MSAGKRVPFVREMWFWLKILKLREAQSWKLHCENIWGGFVFRSLIFFQLDKKQGSGKDCQQLI